MTVGTTTKEYYYFGDTLLAIRIPSLNAWTDMIYAGEKKIAVVVGSQAANPYYLVSDVVGSEAGSVDNKGNQLASLDYSPFGQVISGNSSDPYIFTGLERDPSGLDYATFRQYSSTTGRWTEPDPYDGSYHFDDPQSLNRYTYVRNNPLRFTDPSGRDPFTLYVVAYCTHTFGAGCFSANPAAIAGLIGASVAGLIADLGEILGSWGQPSFVGNTQAQSKGKTPRTSDNGRCLSNVKSFVDANLQNAQQIADKLGNGVSAEEVLATSGNESTYGTSSFAKFGNYFGIHGSGPAGTYYTTDNNTAVAKFPVSNGFMVSGQVFIGLIKPYLTPQIAADPKAFFTLLNHHGYATGNSNYPSYMVGRGAKRGSYSSQGLYGAPVIRRDLWAFF